MAWWPFGDIDTTELREDSPLDDVLAAYAVAAAERIGAAFHPPDRSRFDPERVTFVVPGVFGSTLYEGDDLLWIDPADLVLDDACRRLALPGSGRVAAGAPLELAYAILAHDLSALGEVRPFAYDWRSSIDAAADRLAEELLALRARSPRARAHVVAHSMGALVVRRAAQRTDDAVLDVVEQVIALAPPYRGSHAATEALAGSHPWFESFGARASEMQRALATAPALYELMPAPGHGDHHASAWWPESLRLEPASLARAAAFHREAAARPTALDARTDVIATVDRRTAEHVRWDGERLEVATHAAGDGTVLASSTVVAGQRSRWLGHGDHAILPLLAPIRRAVVELVETRGARAGALERRAVGDLGGPLAPRLAEHARHHPGRYRALARFAGF